MSKSLFEEAIADARQLREAAEANAKNAIIEAVTPRIREFIETQLVGGKSIDEGDFLSSTLISEDDDVNTDEEVELDESALRSLASLMYKSDKPHASEDGVALQEAFENLTEQEQAQLLSMLREEDAVKTTAKDTSSPDAKIDSKSKASESLYEIDLEELKAAVVKEGP
jgi:hypothetical protein